MKHTLKFPMGLVSCVVFFSGCGRVVDWAKEKVPQGQKHKADITSPEKYVRSAKLHDQFKTVAIFDAMWASDEVRTAFANLVAFKSGKNDEQRKAFLRRQLAENDHFILFYVLSTDIAELGESSSDWTLFLQVGNRSFAAKEIKQIDLCPEYKAFFGKKFNRYKIAYRVKFDAKDVDESPLIKKDTYEMSLRFMSMKKETTLSWNVGADCKCVQPTVTA